MGSQRLWPARNGISWLVARDCEKAGQGRRVPQGFPDRKREKDPKNLRTLWDWFYLSQVRQETRETYEAARSLARLRGDD